MRILVFTDYFLPHATGGIERAAYEVSRRIAAQGHEVTVLTFRHNGAPAEEEMDGLHVVRVPAVDASGLTGIQLSASAHVWPVARRLIRQRRIDLLHAHGLFFHASLAAAVLGRATGVPLITTAHVGSLDSIGGLTSRLSAAYEQSIGRFILGSSRQVIAVSRAVADHVEKLGADCSKVSVIANGVDLGRYAPAPRRGRGRRPLRMVFVGRLIANKGPQHLLDALPGVCAAFPDAECWFVGEGPMRQELEQTVQDQHLSDNVRFLGEREDVPELLAQCDLFVRPSLSEGMPLAVLEAMAAGLPVVVTPVGGTAELVEDGETGFLAEPRDTSALEARICQLLGDGRLRRSMGASGRRTAAGYDWDAVSQRTWEVYSKVVHRGRPEPAELSAV